jgi:hypothetical protein
LSGRRCEASQVTGACPSLMTDRSTQLRDLRRADPRPPRRPSPVPVPGRRPVFQRAGPSLAASGVNGHHGPSTKSGDAPLREALFMAADQGRRIDSTLAARYHRAHGGAGQAPQLRALPHLHSPAHPDHRLLAGRHLIPDPRPRRHPAHHPQGRAIVARRSDTSPPPTQRYDHQPKPLTPLKNSQIPVHRRLPGRQDPLRARGARRAARGLPGRRCDDRDHPACGRGEEGA